MKMQVLETNRKGQGSTVWFMSLSLLKTKQRKQIFFKAAKHCQFGHFSQLYERKQSLESDCGLE